MPGRIEFTLPLRITISLADLPSVSIRPDATTGAGSTPTPDQKPDTKPPLETAPSLSPSLKKQKEEVLQELERNRTRPYLDSEKESADRTAYYQGIELSDDDEANFDALAKLVRTAHKTKPKYAPTRQLYPWIDLHKDDRRLLIKSIYSGQVFDARDFIEEAFRIEARRESLRMSMRANEALSNVSEAIMEDLLEAAAPYNCEHVVPQSWFSKKEPMRGDLHHLFACESRCNSFRGNHAYFDFPPSEAVMDLCGRREEDQFEPGSGKGTVARATLYFLLRYPGSIDLDISRMDRTRIDTLIDWHNGDPVTEYERHRNQAIFEVQGNRNPFVDDASWVARVRLVKGLG